MSKIIQLHIYRAENGEIEVNVVNNEVWLTQKTMALLFGVTVKTVSEHINNVMRDDGLDNSSIRKFRIVTEDGKQRSVNHYNLDVILPVGFRVNSKEATRFRRWASHVIADYITHGIAINQVGLDSLDPETLDRVADSSIKHFVTSYRKLGFSDEKIRARLNGIVSRNYLTDMIHDKVVDAINVNYGAFTNRTYTGLFQRNSEQLKQQNGGLKPRDGMTTEGLELLSAAESSVARYINDRDYVRYFEALIIMDRVCRELRPAIEGLQKLLGIDLGTSQPLLPDGNSVA